MCAKTYSPDFECNVLALDIEKVIPLCFNTIYYVECPNNEELNLFVQQRFAEDLNATLPHDLRKIPYRFRYITQKELQPDNFRKHLAELGADDNGPATDATIDFLRECLYADTGGYLVARQLTKISDKDDENDKIGVEEHLITFPLLDADDKEEGVKRLLRAVAIADFKILSGVAYHRYYSDKYERRAHQSSHSPETMTIGLIVVPLDIPEIDAEIDRKAKLLDKEVNHLLPNDDDEAILIAQRFLDLRKNKRKINKLCALSVDDRGKIYYQIDGKEVECKFVRGSLGRTLYILYLRQIERAAKDWTGKTPSSICRNHLNKYEDELLEIYTSMSPSGSPFERQQRIEDLWRNPSNVISKNNQFFEETFNAEAITPNYYTIEVVGYDENGDELEAVGLETEDFDLGDFSIDKLRV